MRPTMPVLIAIAIALIVGLTPFRVEAAQKPLERDAETVVASLDAVSECRSERRFDLADGAQTELSARREKPAIAAAPAYMGF